MLKRKIDIFLLDWKKNIDRNPLIVYGARQIGKTTSIELFAAKNYENFVEINFIKNPEFVSAFKTPDPDQIIKRLTIINPNLIFVPHKTLIFIDEIQEYMNATTSFKFFKLDGKYDVICSGSALGINNSSISSVSVGFKDEYIMYPLDFEEFLWAYGYTNDFVDNLLSSMINMIQLDDLLYNILDELYTDFIFLGGYPKIVSKYFENGENFSKILPMQKALFKDYKDDISKYLTGLDITKAQRVYDSITPQLSKENHKFQFSKLGHGARFNSYYGVAEWLKNAGIVIITNNVNLELPLKGNEEIDNYRMYYIDTSLLIASLDEETQNDLRNNLNIGIYKGAIYENIIASSLIKQNYDFYFHRSEDSTVELDFVLRFKNEILPIEVKAKNGRAKSLKAIIENMPIIYKGIKFAKANIGFNNNIYTFPYFLSFLLRRFLDELKKAN